MLASSSPLFAWLFFLRLLSSGAGRSGGSLSDRHCDVRLGKRPQGSAEGVCSFRGIFSLHAIYMFLTFCHICRLPMLDVHGSPSWRGGRRCRRRKGGGGGQAASSDIGSRRRLERVECGGASPGKILSHTIFIAKAGSWAPFPLLRSPASTVVSLAAGNSGSTPGMVAIAPAGHGRLRACRRSS